MEARNEDDEVIGRSNIIKTILPVEGSSIALDQAETVLSCNISNAANNEFDTDYDYDGDHTNDPVSYSYDDADRPWTVHSVDLKSALVGFVAAATIFIVMSFCRRRSWRARRNTGPKYQPLASKDTDSPFADGYNDGIEANGVELKER